jgi:hypothetical protein
MTGRRSALARHRADDIPFRVPRVRDQDGWLSVWSGARRMAFRRPGCGKGAGPTFPRSLAGDG